MSGIRGEDEEQPARRSAGSRTTSVAFSSGHVGTGYMSASPTYIVI